MKRAIKTIHDFTFVQLIYLWVSIGLSFAIIYYLLNLLTQNSLLYLNQPLNNGFSDFLTIVYFSFITLTSTGYGDVVPLGISKLLSIIEIFFGLIVFGFLISKLISAKQGGYKGLLGATNTIREKTVKRRGKKPSKNT